MEKYELSAQDREFLAKQKRIQRRRQVQALKASGASGVVALIAAGGPALGTFWLTGNWEFAAIMGTPGLALAAHLLRRMHPDFTR